MGRPVKAALAAAIAALCVWTARVALAAWGAPSDALSPWGPCIENYPARRYLGFRAEISEAFAERLAARRPTVVPAPREGPGSDAVRAAVSAAVGDPSQLVGLHCQADGCLVGLATVPEWGESQAVSDTLVERGWRARPWAGGSWGTGHIDEDDREDRGRWEVLLVRDPAVHRARPASRAERRANLVAALWGAFEADRGNQR